MYKDEMRKLVEEFNQLVFRFDVFEVDGAVNFELYIHEDYITRADEITEKMDAILEVTTTDETWELEEMIVSYDSIREESFPRVKAIIDKFEMSNTMENAFECIDQDPEKSQQLFLR